MNEPEPEGWSIPTRRYLLGGITLIAVLVAGTFGAGLYYRAHVESSTHPRIATFPGPHLERTMRAPDEPAPPPRTAPSVTAAGRAVIAEGDGFWDSQ